MPSLDEYVVQPQHIEQGVVALKQRQRKLSLWCMLSAVLFIASSISYFLQHDFVYSFFGLSTEIQQLHMPMSVDANLASLGHQPDYFLNLLSWFGWLVLKIMVSFIGAFILVHYARKIHFFYVRFQSFILKFVAWLIAFILLWSGLTYVQYDLKDDESEAFQQIVHYDKNIQQSEIAQYLQQSQIQMPVKHYLLAQTALLHQPVDKNAAIPHVLALVQAEKTDSHFIEYGFKPEQLWTMQHQLYGKTLTPMAASVEKQVQQAAQFTKVMQFFSLILMLLMAVLSLVLFGLTRQLKARTLRIEQRLQSES